MPANKLFWNFLREITIFGFFLLIFAGGTSFADEASSDGIVCNGYYALCTSARCIPDPRAPLTYGICSCEVRNGTNFGLQTNCGQRIPFQSMNDGSTKQVDNIAEITTAAAEPVSLRSTYSFGQAADKSVMKCEAGSAWTDCLDARCTLDPTDPLKAICTCKIGTKDGAHADQDFVTFGGDCNTLSCVPSLWSAATIPSFKLGTEVMTNALGLDTAPVSYCSPEQKTAVD
ncbi:hypothetical protein [uncultured Roseibium sp.]|uniref:hypothetical protein n=1 Tax=uncultured Roseibium sp. TaxID=1936171 RepID=UPI0032168409